ncbi:MAG: sterol desaturase family protein [Pseudomonadota bacterium]
MEFLANQFQEYLLHAKKTFLTLASPDSRVFFVYLISSLAIAFVIYKSAKRKLSSDERTFLRFLFPKKVWTNPSAWLDLRYFFFHNLTGKFLALSLGALFTVLGFRLTSGGLDIQEAAAQGNLSTWADIGIATGYMLVAMVVSDFLGWFCHWLQHKSPLLWQFHKVHHSAEVMHPVSNFREHPIDNLLYGTVIGGGFGVVAGLALNIFGYVPSMPALLGVPLVMLAFNLVGYNLRHSHIWLRWPGKLSMIFPSPAHHHVHHSYHPDHIDKNFAFIFPVWDVIFKTYHMPEDNKDVAFGIGEGNADELTSCTRLYWVPFRDALRVLRVPNKDARAFDMSKPPAPGEKIEHPHPAE